MSPRSLAILMLSAAVATLQGCASPRPAGPYAPASESDRDEPKARKLNAEAASLLASDPARAETILREALAADLYCGPAHNNLGVLYLQRGDLYAAAGEFEWARKLLPGHPDPRLNLALTLERAGRTDEALATYATALEVYRDHLPTQQAMSLLQVRSGRQNDGTVPMLREIALRGETDRWRDWARQQLHRTDARDKR